MKRRARVTCLLACLLVSLSARAANESAPVERLF
jgi:hypothetical protein